MIYRVAHVTYDKRPVWYVEIILCLLMEMTHISTLMVTWMLPHCDVSLFCILCLEPVDEEDESRQQPRTPSM